ncbi:helix-hairpin-helix domain-containing protein [Propionivibrio soli]|uniref:helix-hairpin-helix domain-containing protein n=1 Tax=Propionivibrio soli TaxID=2976531 RepID=UPI0021E7B4A4|nr:helix-hairpin-helix domain-containing protein [Propionivibrio soli]
MSDTSDCRPESRDGSLSPALPTRQRNALRALLDKPSFSPQEIAALDFRVVARAPGIGRKSLDLINAWLNGYGYQLSGMPRALPNSRQARRRRELERAIRLLRSGGYVVHGPE